MATVQRAIENFLSSAEYPVLFAGAGVSARAGLPVWSDLLDRLMKYALDLDRLTALQMEEKIRQGNLTKAAEYFFISDQILDGDKYQFLVEQLSSPNSAALKNLVSLPFKSFLTTNFDRSLHLSFPGGSLPFDYRYGDHSFGNAIWQRGRYIARIHGCIESPRSIVLTGPKFKELEDSQTYRDLLTAAFTRQNVMFLGFSFYDPAIKNVLEQLGSDYGSAPPGRHIALVPDNLEGEFIAKLAWLNIQAVRYPAAENHRAIWDAFDEVATSKSRFTKDSAPRAAVDSDPFGPAKRYLAACYARVHLASHMVPLREVIVEGMVSGILQQRYPGAVLLTEIVEALHKELGISVPDSEKLVHTAVAALRADALCTQIDEGHTSYKWSGSAAPEQTFRESLDFLVRSIRDRAVVQEGWHIPDPVVPGMSSFLKDLILQRGWDLGAAYAANRPPDNVDISKLLELNCIQASALDREKLRRVCESLLTHPSESEANILSQLGRVSFALELAVQSPRTVLFHSVVLPERIYLDSNVLMRALTVGHPFYDVYRNTIERLKAAAMRAAIPLQLIAYYGFLNEIVSHRRLAIGFFETHEMGFDREIAREILYRGVNNVNVFLGAFAQQKITRPGLRFQDFLQRSAPYKNEDELAKWLAGKGIVVVRDKEMIGPMYAKFSYALQKAYSSGLIAGKDVRLVEHDAYQLSGLAKDRDSGRRAVLVTADKTLRDVVGASEFGSLSQNMVSNVGLAQLIDLLVGSPTADGGMTGLLWMARASKKTEVLRSYLTALGLMEYNQALAMEMPKVVEDIAERINEALLKAKVDPESPDPAKREEAFRIMGMYEKEFFEGMRASIERLERQRRNPQ